MILAPRQPIPHGRPYRYHLNGPVYMMTARKRVGPLPTHRLAVGHSFDYSSSDHFASDDSSRYSSSSSSLETSSDPSLDDLSDSLSDHSLPAPSSEMDDDVERSDEIDIDPEIQAEIDECIAYADALRVRGIDARVVVEAIDQEEIEMGARGPIEVRVDRVTHPVIADDIPEPTQEEGAVEVMYETLGDMVQRFHNHTKEILVHRVQAIESLERDNMRLRDMVDVASQRVAQSQRRELRVQREMRQIRRFKFYDRMRIARLEAYARRHLGYRS
ncbi:hypothetical protein Tco_1010003 [Tanacetum coccineum]